MKYQITQKRKETLEAELTPSMFYRVHTVQDTMVYNQAS